MRKENLCVIFTALGGLRLILIYIFDIDIVMSCFAFGLYGSRNAFFSNIETKLMRSYKNKCFMHRT